MRYRYYSAIAALSVLACLIAASRVSAHHSFAMFDLTQEKTLSGTVTDFQWTNPHTWIWMNVRGESGEMEQWGFEGQSPNYLQRRGWSRHELKAGDEVTVVFHPVRTGAKGGAFIRGSMASGKALGTAPTNAQGK